MLDILGITDTFNPFGVLRLDLVIPPTPPPPPAPTPPPPPDPPAPPSPPESPPSEPPTPPVPPVVPPTTPGTAEFYTENPTPLPGQPMAEWDKPYYTPKAPGSQTPTPLEVLIPSLIVEKQVTTDSTTPDVRDNNLAANDQIKSIPSPTSQ